GQPVGLGHPRAPRWTGQSARSPGPGESFDTTIRERADTTTAERQRARSVRTGCSHVWVFDAARGNPDFRQGVGRRLSWPRGEAATKRETFVAGGTNPTYRPS